MYEIPDTSGLIEKTDCNKEIAEVEFWKKMMENYGILVIE